MASGAAVASQDGVGKADEASDQDRRAAEAAAAAAVLASLIASAGKDKSDEKADGKPRTTIDLLDQNQKSFAKLMSEADKKGKSQAKPTSAPTEPNETRSSDSKRVANAYAAYAAYDADEPKKAA